MSNIIKTSTDILTISCLLIAIYGWYCLFSVMKFIVKRYEQETDIQNTVFFSEHFIFGPYLPNFLSASAYATHLVICAWGWKYFSKKPMFRDIESSKEITKHFSGDEIFRAKRLLIIYALLGFIMIPSYILIEFFLTI